MLNKSKSIKYNKYELLALAKVQELTAHRETKMSQEKVTEIAGVSLKTIQRFENYKCLNNAYLFWVYANI